LGPLVSVLINNFNYGLFLSDAIDSALGQAYSNTEIIVVDDGSLDVSRDVIRGYGNRIISLFKPNGGQASAFNSAFAASKGEWILFLDSDDYFAPAKAETILSHAYQFGSAALIAHNLNYCDGENRPFATGNVSFEALKLVDDRKRARQGKLRINLPATSALALRRDILSQILPMPEEGTATQGRVLDQADNYIKIAALSLTPVLLIPERLATQRIHGENLYSRLGDKGETKLEWYLVRARIAFRLKERYPSLSKLVWKQYGRMLFQLSNSKSPGAKRILEQVRADFSPFEYSPVCCFYVCGAFFKSLLTSCMRVSGMQ